MDFERFSRGYRPFRDNKREREDGHERHINAEIEAEMTESRHWHDYFSRVITGTLTEKPVNKEAFFKGFTTYCDWAIKEVPRLEKFINQRALDDPADTEYLQELTFHLSAPYMSAEWWALVEPDYSPEREERIESQSWLSIVSARLARSRKVIEAKKTQTISDRETLGNINGRLNELDGLIVLLEIASTRDDDLIVLPAPRKFEDTHSSRNADILLLDRAKHHVRGVQSKTVVATDQHYLASDDISPIYKYDTSFVTIIDGVHDLGNTEAKRRPGTSRTFSRAFPGLLAMEHLNRIPIPFMPQYNNPAARPYLLQAKGIARELAGNRRPFIAQATKNVADKVMFDLYKETPDEQVAV